MMGEAAWHWDRQDLRIQANHSQFLGIISAVREGPQNVGQDQNFDFPDSSDILAPMGQRDKSCPVWAQFQNSQKGMHVK